jgi:hypothetical protein
LVTTIKAADGSSATLVRDDDAILNLKNRKTQRQRNAQAVIQSSPLNHSFASKLTRTGKASLGYRKKADLLNDPAVLRDVSDLVRDNDAILADYVSQMKYGRDAKEMAY